MWLFYAHGREFGGIKFLSCLSVATNFNLGHNFWTTRDRHFIFGMHTQLMKPFQMAPRSMKLWPSSWPLTYIYKNFNLSHNFWTIWGRASIFHMCIPCEKAFLFISNYWPNDLDLWPTWLKTLTFAITFDPLEVGLWYLVCMFDLWGNPFKWQGQRPCALDFNTKIAILDFVVTGTFMFHKHILFSQCIHKTFPWVCCRIWKPGEKRIFINLYFIALGLYVS